jgi:hypothetical protein
MSSWRAQSILPLLLHMIFLDCIQKQDHISLKFANFSTFAMSAFQESSLHIFWLHSNKQCSTPIFRSMYIRLEEQTCLMRLRTLCTQYTSQQTCLMRLRTLSTHYTSQQTCLMRLQTLSTHYTSQETCLMRLRTLSTQYTSQQTCLMRLRTLSTQYTSQKTNLARRLNRMVRDGQKWCSAL